MAIRILEYFKSTNNLLQKYDYLVNFNESLDDKDKYERKYHEVRKRIEQLDYLYSSIKQKNDETARIQKQFQLKRREWEKQNNVENNPETPFSKELEILYNKYMSSMDDSFLIELHFEHFYYIAARIRTIVRYLPGIGKKFESEGIRNVRNHIIEHPDKEDFSANGFSYGNIKNGPIINTFKDDDNKHVYKDKGLYCNAEEFKSNLEALLEKYIDKKDEIFRQKVEKENQSPDE